MVVPTEALKLQLLIKGQYYQGDTEIEDWAIFLKNWI
jgi:hypothetical protein